MYIFSETTDWTDTFDFSQNLGGYIQPGYTVTGTVGGSDTGDYIRTSMAYGQPYTFVLSGEGVSFEMLDDGNPVVAQINGNTLTYTTTHPSDFADIRVTGNGSYSVAMVGIAADYVPDEDSGTMVGAPDLEFGTSISGVINGSGGTRETDYYAIQVFSGQTYNFAMTQADSPYGATSGAEIQILDAAGDPILTGGSWSASAWDNGATYTFSPSVSGVYYVRADTYFGSFGAYTLTASIGDAPTAIANVDAVTADEGFGTTSVTVRIALDAATLDNISGTITLTAADADYSRAATTFDATFTVESGDTFVDVTIPAGTVSDFGEDTVFVASIAEVNNAQIGQGFLASETYNSGANTASEGDDVLRGTQGRDSINALGGDDNISGLGGRDLLIGGAGDDTLNGGRGNDIIRAGSDNDQLSGAAGRDRLFGNSGQDQLFGNKGNDRLYGNNGRDTLNGGSGDDLLKGGGQADTFVFSGAFGNDTIQDFSEHKNAEKIDLSGVEEITGRRDLRDHHMSQDGDDVVIQDGIGNTITLLDVDMSDLGRYDFIF